MIDYHIHPDYSIDADPFSMDQYCSRAVEIGLGEICFTTHYEFDPVRADLDWFVRCGGKIVPMHPASGWLDTYFAEAAACAVKYAPQGLKVRTGIEAGYDLGLEKKIEEVLLAYPFDFVIGSVHCLDHVAISSKKESMDYYKYKKLHQVAADYYHTLREAVKSGLFDVIGHLDIYRRHGTAFFGEETASVFGSYIEDILKEMVKTKTGLELNTSSFRHGQGSFYPHENILSMARRSGVSVFTAGSDCHRLSELGMGISEAMERGKKLGINVCGFEKRKAIPVSF